MNTLTILNCYGSGICNAQKDITISGQDVIVLSDFNAKLGRNDFVGGPIGSHDRRIQNENGELINDWLGKNRILASNTLF